MSELPLIDFNGMALSGHVRTSRRKLKGEPKPGHVMQAYEVSDGNVWLCYIVSVEERAVMLKPLGEHRVT